MSDTPKTDAEAFFNLSRGGYLVSREFSREQERTINALVEALEKAADTFSYLQRTLSLIGRGPSVEACKIAEEFSRSAIAKARGEA